jgi:nucleotide-binding universal stress UspA family protein
MSTVFSRLLLATERSEFDRGAETLAFDLARHCGLPLSAVLPIVSNPEYEALAPQLAAHAEAQAAERIRVLRAEAEAAGVALSLSARRGPEPFREIVDEAAERRADLIIIRRRGKRGFLADLLMGEMVRNVVTHAPCSVLVTPRAAQMWSTRVLVALDPLKPEGTPLATAAAVAAECGLPLTVVCATGPGSYAASAAELALQPALLTCARLGVQADGVVRVGTPHQQILAAAQEWGADLVVVGRHGDDSLSRPWLGGVTQKVVGLADRPVLVAVTTRTKDAAA